MWGPYLDFLFNLFNFFISFSEREIFGANLPLGGFVFASSGFFLAQALYALFASLYEDGDVIGALGLLARLLFLATCLGFDSLRPE